MKNIPTDKALKEISLRERINKYPEGLLSIPIIMLVWLLKIVGSVIWKIAKEKVIPFLDKEFLVQVLGLNLLIILSLFAICIFLIIQLKKKPIREVLNLCQDSDFNIYK